MSIRKHTIWNLIGSLLPMVAGLLLIPILMANVGLERFGILTLIWALIGYFAIFDLGVGRALTYTVSKLLSSHLLHEIPIVVRYGVSLMATVGTIGAILLALFANLLGYRWLNVTEALQADATSAIVITAFAIPLVTVTAGLRGILEAYGRFTEANVLKVVLGVGNFAMPLAAVLLFNPSLENVAVSLVFIRFFVLIPHLYFVSRLLRKQPSNQPHSTMGNQYHLLLFGGWMTVSNLVSPLMVTADRFLITYLLGASVVAYYTVPLDVLLRLLVIPAALTVALFPRFAAIYETDRHSFRALYARSSAIVLAVMAAICIVVALTARWALTVWLGEDFSSKAATIASIISLGILLNGMAQVPHTAIQAAGGVKVTALLHIAEFVLYVPLLYFCVLRYGLNGAAVAWTARAAFDLVLLRYIAAKTIARCAEKEYAR